MSHLATTVDWSQIPSEFNYVARDSDGSLYAFTHKPFLDEGIFYASKGTSFRLDNYLGSNIPRGECVKRPEKFLVNLTDEQLLEMFTTAATTLEHEILKRIFQKLISNNSTIKVT